MIFAPLQSWCPYRFWNLNCWSLSPWSTLCPHIWPVLCCKNFIIFQFFRLFFGILSEKYRKRVGFLFSDASAVYNANVWVVANRSVILHPTKIPKTVEHYLSLGLDFWELSLCLTHWWRGCLFAHLMRINSHFMSRRKIVIIENYFPCAYKIVRG